MRADAQLDSPFAARFDQSLLIQGLRFSVAAGETGQSETEERAVRQLVEIGENAPELHLLIGKAYLQRLKNDEALDGRPTVLLCEQGD
jgi:hypothetical protein